ncbi:MAG: PilN domain-containing protein [Pirellulaceae bacterium]
MNTHLNLLPVGYLRARLIRRRLAVWAPIWLALILLGAANWWASYAACDEAAAAREARERQYQPVQRTTTQVNVLRRQIEELNSRENVLDDLLEPHPPLSGLGFIGRSAAACGGRVRVNRMVLERSKTTAPAARRQTGAPRQAGAAEHASDAVSRITLDGAGLDNQAIAAFVEALKSTGAFRQVELNSTIRTGDEIDAMRTFVVTCEY